MAPRPFLLILVTIFAICLAAYLVVTGRVLAQEEGGMAAGARSDANAPTVDCGPDDAYEDNDTIGTAAPVTAGNYSPLILCSADSLDYFAVDVPAGHTLHVELAFTHSNGDIDLSLYDTTGAQVSGSDSASDDEAAEMTVAASGTYYVGVSLVSGSNNTYTMRLRVSCADCVSYQGRLEDGGAPANGSYELQFALYDAAGPEGQLVAGPITRTTAVAGGLFTTELYFGATVDTYDASLLGQAPYLEIGARPAGSAGPFTVLSPRQQLTGAPYAQTALTVQAGALISGTVPGGTLELFNNQGHGLVVESAGLAGVNVKSASNNGVVVNTVGLSGMYVGSAGASGVYVDSASNNGVVVSSAGLSGVYVGSTVFGSGVYVGSAGASGVYVGSAADDGVVVGSANFSGVYVVSAGDDGVYVNSAGDDGVHVVSAGGDGVYVRSAGGDGFQLCRTGSSTTCNFQATLNGIEALNAQDYSGYFGKDIFVNGSCSGCLLSTFGVNAGSGTLQPGDVVTLRQLADGESLGLSMLMEVEAAQAGQPIVGVVDGWAELVVPDDPESEEQAGLAPRGGPSAPGEYVSIIIYGPIQVKADARAGAIEMGQKLAVDNDGMARPIRKVQVDGVSLSEDAPTVGIALSDVDEDGMVWVLVNPQ